LHPIAFERRLSSQRDPMPLTVLLNSAMVAERSEHLGAAPYERSSQRVGYANGYKDKFPKTRLGTLSLKVPQTRDGEF